MFDNINQKVNKKSIFMQKTIQKIGKFESLVHLNTSSLTYP